MPAYEYRCKDCNMDFTLFCSLKEYEAGPKVRCPHCGSDYTVKKVTGFFAKTSRKA